MSKEIEKAARLVIDALSDYWGNRIFVCQKTSDGILMNMKNTRRTTLYNGGLVLLVKNDGIVEDFQIHKSPKYENAKYLGNVEIDFDKKRFRLIDD